MGTRLFEGLASIGVFFPVLPVLIPVVLGSAGILAVVLLECATVLFRRDRRSFAGLVGATTTCTHDGLAAEPQGDGQR